MEEERIKSGEVMATKIMEKEIYMFDTKSDDALVNECREMKKDFYVYNSMNSKELFKPKVPGKVGMYLCGITPSDYSHVGHARVAVAFDILYRYLQHLGYNVIYVRNFTDVDDKIIEKANELKESILTLSTRFSQKFLDDMIDLQCLPPTHEPRVSDHVDHIIDIINQIISNGCAYVVGGDVKYCVGKFPNYGCLSRQNPDEMIAGKRVGVGAEKKNPCDFALWKAAKPDEPSWESPWGRGRPGWHIECSAMSSHYLSFKFDIHGGGRDLIFPHHENEIAQNWAACSDSNVGYWMHMGRVTLKDVKMSKSEGNSILIHEVTKFYHPLALRHYLLSTHYRSPMNYSALQLYISSEAIFYIYQTLQDCEVATAPFRARIVKEGTESNVETAQITLDAQSCINGLHGEFETKMSDDLQTPPILSGAILKSVKFMNKTLNNLKSVQKKHKQLHLSLIHSLIKIEEAMREVLDILGLLSPLPYSQVLQQLKGKALERAGLSEESVLNLIERRAQARKEQDFEGGDQIRKDLAGKGIALMDVAKETIWMPCVPVGYEDQATPTQIS